MASKTFVLLDASTGTVAEPRTIAPSDVGGGAQGYRIVWKRLRGGLSDGVDVLEVESAGWSYSLVPTRGLGIWKASRGGVNLGWRSPVSGPVHPHFVDVGEPSGLGWLDGFDELLVRCGLESNGAPEFDEKTGQLKYPLHGRIGNRPAHRLAVTIDGDSGEIQVRGLVDESRFHFLNLRLTSTITTRPGAAGLAIRDEVENRAASRAEFQMLYHVNFGAPLLDGGARFVAPAKTIVPRNDHAARDIDRWDSYAAPQAGYQEQVYFLQLKANAQSRTRALLKNAHGTQGASLLFDVRQLPWFTLWKDTGAIEDGYVTGLEPGTNFPNPRSYEGEQGRVVPLAPGAKTAFDVTLEAHATAAEVEAAERDIAQLAAAGSPPQIHRQPQPGWCA